jgi:Na+/H+ antiporter NhaD/arsenite permease-like protein
MLHIKNYRDNHDEIVHKISTIIEHIFDENTLVLYDIRSSIISSVLPHIPYVATYDQRVISMLHHATLICSEPFDRTVLDHYQSI